MANKKNKVSRSPEKITPLRFTDLDNYWNEERKRNAIPIEVKELEPHTKRALATFARDEAIQEVLTESFIPNGVNIAKEQQSPNQGFTTTRVENIDLFPYTAIGKLFMTFDDQDFVGSAWVIGESAIFTAGHCVYDEKHGWADNIIFDVDYDGRDSSKRWTIKQAFSLDGWTKEQDFQYDMAVCITSTPIGDVTGRLGTTAHLSATNGVCTSVGYPAQKIPGYNFDGRLTWKCQGNFHNDHQLIQMDNNMTGGCSGGPVFIVRNGKFYAIGLNSFSYTNEPNKLYSPYFGEGFVSLQNIAQEAEVLEPALV